MMSKKFIAILIGVIAAIVLVVVALLVVGGETASNEPDAPTNKASVIGEDSKSWDAGSGGASGIGNNDTNNQSEVGTSSMNTSGSGGSSTSTEIVSTTESIAEGEQAIRLQETLMSVLTQSPSMDAYNVSQNFAVSVPSQFDTPDNLAANIIRYQSMATLTESCSFRDPVIESCDVVGSSFGYTTYRMRMRMLAYDISPQEAGMFIPDQTVTYDVTAAANQDGKIVFLSMDFDGYSDVRYL